MRHPRPGRGESPVSPAQGVRKYEASVSKGEYESVLSSRDNADVRSLVPGERPYQ